MGDGVGELGRTKSVRIRIWVGVIDKIWCGWLFCILAAYAPYFVGCFHTVADKPALHTPNVFATMNTDPQTQALPPGQLQGKEQAVASPKKVEYRTPATAATVSPVKKSTVGSTGTTRPHADTIPRYDVAGWFPPSVQRVLLWREPLESGMVVGAVVGLWSLLFFDMGYTMVWESEQIVSASLPLWCWCWRVALLISNLLLFCPCPAQLWLGAFVGKWILMVALAASAVGYALNKYVTDKVPAQPVTLLVPYIHQYGGMAAEFLPNRSAITRTVRGVCKAFFVWQ